MQFALRGNTRIKLAQAAGGGVAWVGKGFLPVFGLSFIEGGEIGFEHQHFAAHFDEFGRIFAVQPQGDIRYGFDVLGNVFAGRAVAARRRLHQYAVAVEQADGEAVEFGFDNVFGIAAVQAVAHALVEGVHFGMVEHAVFILRGEGVGQRQHRHFVAHFGKSRQRLAADALGRAVGQLELGMVSFQRFEFAEQFVVFGIGYAGRVEGVVFVGVAVEEVGKVADVLCGLIHGGGFSDDLCLIQEDTGKGRLKNDRLKTAEFYPKKSGYAVTTYPL